MATVSNPATLNSVKTVFGGGGTLRSYLRGGSYVPNIAAYSGIAASGDLSLASFSGIVYPSVQLNPANEFVTSITAGSGSGTAEADVRLNANGTQQIRTFQSIPEVGPLFQTSTWLLYGNASDYQGMFLKNGGNGPSFGYDAVNTWFTLSSSVQWGVKSSASGSASDFDSLDGYLLIRPAGGGVELANVFISLTTSVEP